MTGAVKVFYPYEKGFHLSGKSDKSLKGVLHCILNCLFFKKTFSDVRYRPWQTYTFCRMIACMGENGLF